MKTRTKKLKIGTFNARGLLQCAEQVAALMASEILAVLTVKQTWLKPEKVMPIRGTHESVRLPARGHNKRRHGGVTLLFNTLMQYQVLQKHAEPAFQFVAVATTGIQIVGLYINPPATNQDVNRLLQQLQQGWRGLACIISDLNSRHTDWDRTSNARERLMAK